MSNGKLIVHLIREELRNKRLMYSLEDLGFDCSAYIWILAGKSSNSPASMKEPYFSLIDNALKETTFWNLLEMLDKWSEIIYGKLLERRG